MILIHKLKDQVYDRIRRRMIRETEIALSVGLMYPDRAIRIPTLEIGRGAFHPDYTARFWSELLDHATTPLPVTRI